MCAGISVDLLALLVGSCFIYRGLKKQEAYQAKGKVI